MSDYISRQSAINALYHHFPHMTREECAAILHEVGDVKIIRCEDCKHWQYDFMTGKGWCDGRERSEDWFCADAKRREDE